MTPALLVYTPVAVHAILVVHDTPFRALALAPLGLGVPWIVQLVPFQRSASVDWTPALLWYSPVAVQTVLVVHDTPLRALSLAPVGLGVLWIVQLAPFQLSASVAIVPALLV